MKYFICSLFVVALLFGCAGGKSMTLEQEAAVVKMTEGHALAGTLELSGNSETITIKSQEMKVRLGQPILVVPRVTLKGLEVDIYIVGPEKGGIEAENF